MNGNRKSRLAGWMNQWLPALIMMGLIYYFSSIPSSEMVNFGSWDALVKKSGHFLGYALLGLTYLRGTKNISLRSCGFSLLLVAVYALSDEYHQSFVAGRTSTLVDVGIDTIGAAAGLLSARLIHPLGRNVVSGLVPPAAKESR